LLGLLVSLGSQTLGHLAGFDSAMFRGMEIGGQVIAPLAVALGLSEVAARSTAVRFCARLYLPAIALVGVVILDLDQLGQATFTKSWPDPAVFYQVPPDYVLMFAIGPVTALVTLIAVAIVLSRGGQPGWSGLTLAQLMAGVAALALAYPCLAQLVAYLTGVHLPVGSIFAVLCAAAAALVWLAGTRTGRVDLAAIHRGSPGARRSAAGRFDGADTTGDFERGLYREDGPLRDDGRYRGDADGAAYGWRDGYGDGDDWSGREADGDRYDHRDGEPDFATGDIVDGQYGNGQPGGQQFDGQFGDGHYADGQHGDGDVATGDFAPVTGESGWQSPDLRADHDDLQRPPGRRGRSEAQTREQLFGQIAIYTLLEDRVAEFDQLTERVVELVRSREPNSLVFIVHAVPSAPMQRILYEVYRSRDAFEWHTQQPYVQQFAADRRPYVLATNVIELGLQQAKVSPFPSVEDSVVGLFGETGHDTSGFERPDYLRDYGRSSARPSRDPR
jgi:quinol monooxygenase YgiN